MFLCVCVFKGLICIYTFQFFQKKLLSSSELQTLCRQVYSEVFMESPPLHNKNLKPLSPGRRQCTGEKISGRPCFSEKWTFRDPHWAANLHLFLFETFKKLIISFASQGLGFSSAYQAVDPLHSLWIGQFVSAAHRVEVRTFYLPGLSEGSHALICSENDSNLSACCNFRFVEVKLCSSDIS